MSENSLNSNVYGFSIHDHGATGKEYVLNIYEYLIKKSNNVLINSSFYCINTF